MKTIIIIDLVWRSHGSELSEHMVEIGINIYKTGDQLLTLKI